MNIASYIVHLYEKDEIHLVVSPLFEKHLSILDNLQDQKKTEVTILEVCNDMFVDGRIDISPSNDILNRNSEKVFFSDLFYLSKHIFELYYSQTYVDIIEKVLSYNTASDLKLAFQYVDLMAKLGTLTLQLKSNSRYDEIAKKSIFVKIFDVLERFAQLIDCAFEETLMYLLLKNCKLTQNQIKYKYESDPFGARDVTGGISVPVYNFTSQMYSVLATDYFLNEFRKHAEYIDDNHSFQMELFDVFDLLKDYMQSKVQHNLALKIKKMIIKKKG